MQTIAKTYQTAAIVLWGVVCGAAGWSFGFSRGWEGRKLIFAVIVSVGVYGLVLLQWSLRQGNTRRPFEEKVPGWNSEQSGNMKEAVQTQTILGDGQDNGQEKDRNGKDGVRQRLDEFLLMQQDK